MENEHRYDLFMKLIDEFDQGCDLTEEYDALLHNYNGTILFQAESQMIKMIGNHPGITASEISKSFGKTGSASSQLIRKLKEKGWVRQERNQENNRLYNLYLTESGSEIYENHRQFEERCYLRTFHSLDRFSDDRFKYLHCDSETSKCYLPHGRGGEPQSGNQAAVRPHTKDTEVFCLQMGEGPLFV